jgi:hypothetical protein
VSSAGRPIRGGRKISRSADGKIAGPADDARAATTYRRYHRQPKGEGAVKKLRTPVVAAIGCAAICAALLAGGAASASTKAPGTQTLQFLSVTQRIVTVPAITQTAPPQVGGRLIFDDVLTNRVAQFGKPSGARIGRAEGVCTIVSTGAAQCTITAHVPNGQIVVIGSIVLRRGNGTDRYAVVGGGGAYANARGSSTATDLGPNKAVVVLHLST